MDQLFIKSKIIFSIKYFLIIKKNKIDLYRLGVNGSERVNKYGGGCVMRNSTNESIT
jgi:hypothetical protein